MNNTGSARARASSLLLALSVVACGGGTDEDSESLAPGTPVAVEVRPVAAPTPPAARGLVESDVRVSGFPLPVGVTELMREERHYLCLVPGNVADTRRYVAQRILTGRVSALGEGAVYYNSMLREAHGAALHLDISVSMTPRGTELEVTEIPPPQTRELSLQELEEIARRQMLEGR